VWIVSEELLRVGWEEDYGVAKMRIKYSSGYFFLYENVNVFAYIWFG